MLSDPGCVEILLVLLIAERASTADVAEQLSEADVDRVAVQIAQLADLYVIRPTAGGTAEWTITPPMRRALVGFHDQLVAMQALGSVADERRGRFGQGDADSN